MYVNSIRDTLEKYNWEDSQQDSLQYKVNEI